MNITQKDIDDLVYNFKWSKENFKDKKVTDIYRQGIYDVVELMKKKEAESTTISAVGEKGEQHTNKNFKERYENITKYEWLKKTHKDISIGEEQPTEEEMVGMGGLGEVWKEQAIISILDKIYDLLLLRLPIHYPISSPNIDPPIIYDTNKTYCDATTSTEGGEE